MHLVSLVSFLSLLLSHSEISSQVGATTLLEPPALPLGDMDTSTDEENDIHLEMPMEHIITPCGEAQQEVWKRAHLMRRGDRQHDSVVGFTAQALGYVATSAGFETEAELDHDAASL